MQNNMMTMRMMKIETKIFHFLAGWLVGCQLREGGSYLVSSMFFFVLIFCWIFLLLWFFVWHFLDIFFHFISWQIGCQVREWGRVLSCLEQFQDWLLLGASWFAATPPVQNFQEKRKLIFFLVRFTHCWKWTIPFLYVCLMMLQFRVKLKHQKREMRHQYIA